MSRFDQQMREVERSLAKLTGNKTQATQFRRKLETKIQQAAVKKLPKINKALVKSGQAGWVNDPGPKSGAVLVERDTGCVLLDFQGKEIRGPKVSVRSATPLDKAVFLQHLKAVEGFATHMYKDTAGNVTVGIGLLLRDASDAKKLPFVIKGTNTPAHPLHIENAFNIVKNSNKSGASGAAAFEPLTNIEISLAEATIRALNAMDDFLRQLASSKFFPEFGTYPTTVQMGILDLAYTLGPTGTRDKYRNFTAAVRRRNWKLAAKESDRSQVSSTRNGIVDQWFSQAAKQERFFIDPTCRPKRIKIKLR